MVPSVFLSSTVFEVVVTCPPSAAKSAQKFLVSIHDLLSVLTGGSDSIPQNVLFVIPQKSHENPTKIQKGQEKALPKREGLRACLIMN
jgi:hypothetical protein